MIAIGCSPQVYDEYFYAFSEIGISAARFAIESWFVSRFFLLCLADLSITFMRGSVYYTSWYHPNLGIRFCPLSPGRHNQQFSSDPTNRINVMGGIQPR